MNDIGLSLIFLAVAFIYIGWRARQTRRRLGERDQPATRWQAIASIFAVIGGGEYSYAISLILTYGFFGPAFMLGLAAAVFLLRPYVSRLWACAHSQHGFATTKIEGYVNFSTPDYIASVYGRNTSLVVTIFAVAAFAALLMLQYVLGATLISAVTGWEYATSVAFIVLLVATYVIIGSFTALLHTDLFQGLLMWVALGVVVIFIYLVQDSGQSHAQSVNLLFDKTRASISSILDDPTMLTMFFVTLFAAFSGPDIWQRICIVKDKSDSETALFRSGIAFLLFLLPLSLIAIDIHSSGVTQSDDPFRAYIDIKMSSDIALSWPIWLSALFAGGLLAAFVSSADTFALLLSTMVQNEYRRWKPKPDLTLSRSVTNTLVILFSLLGGVIAITEPSIPEQFAAVLSLLSVIGVTVIMSLKNKGNAFTAFLGISLGGIIAIMQAYIFPEYNDGFWVFLPLVPSVFNLFVTRIDSPLYFEENLEDMK